MFKYIHASVVRTAGFRIIRIYRCFFPFVHTHQMTQIYAVSHRIVRHLLYTADSKIIIVLFRPVGICLLYTSDAADEEDSVDIGGLRIIKKKNKTEERYHVRIIGKQK